MGYMIPPAFAGLRIPPAFAGLQVPRGLTDLAGRENPTARDPSRGSGDVI
jgi:hypothetical protein